MYKQIILLLMFVFTNTCFSEKYPMIDEVNEEDDDICKRELLVSTLARCSKEHSKSCCPRVYLHNGDISGNYHISKCGIFKTESCRAGFYLKNDSKVAQCPIGYYCPKDSECVMPCCLLYTSPSPRDGLLSRMPSSA